MVTEDSKPEPYLSALKSTPLWLLLLLYAVMLGVSASVTFEPVGGYVAVPIIGAWAYILWSHLRRRRLARLCVVLVMLLLVGFLLSGIVRGGHFNWRRSLCLQNLKQLGIALHNYHEHFETFPPAIVRSSDGRPMHSWRVLLLPCIGQQELYDRYDFTEPWDGPNNRKLLNEMPEIYRCPNGNSVDGDRQCTSYVAVRGPRTAWPEPDAIDIPGIKDGSAQTLFLVEFDIGEIRWTEPSDLTLDEAMSRFAAHNPTRLDGHQDNYFFCWSDSGRNVLMADCTVRYLRHGVDDQSWSDLLIMDDGQSDAFRNVLPQEALTRRRLRIGNCIRIAIFVFLVLLPLPWALRKDPFTHRLSAD
jgi:hypothetical protein